MAYTARVHGCQLQNKPSSYSYGQSFPAHSYINIRITDPSIFQINRTHYSRAIPHWAFWMIHLAQLSKSRSTFLKGLARWAHFPGTDTKACNVARDHAFRISIWYPSLRKQQVVMYLKMLQQQNGRGVSTMKREGIFGHDGHFESMSFIDMLHT